MRRSLFVGVLLGIGLTAAAATAQLGPTGNGPMGGPPDQAGPAQERGWWGMGWGGRSPEARFDAMCEGVEPRLAAHLAYAETSLKLNDAQKQDWQKLQQAAQQATKPMQSLCGEFKGKPMPTDLPGRLERMEKMAAAHLSALQTLTPAVAEMYGKLTPDQKKTADALQVGMMEHHGHGPWH